MSGPGVDLLADDLIRVEREAPPVERSLGAALAVPPPEPSAVVGTCELCGERDARHRCVHCGRRACHEHFWTMLGLCRECATETEMKAAREGPNRPRPALDIKWIED